MRREALMNSRDQRNWTRVASDAAKLGNLWNIYTRDPLQ